MSVEKLFFIIIIFYGAIGMTRGCIKTLGGLVSILVSGVLAKIFALFMLICGHFVYLFEDLFKKLPLGKTADRVFGFICGLIKGVFVVLIRYFIITCLNIFTSINILVNIGRMGEMIQNTIQAVDINKIRLSVQDAVHNASSR